MAKYLDSTGLTYFWIKIKNWVSGYVVLDNGSLTVGNNTITPITSHQDISGKADKSTTVTDVAYDTTNKKFTKTINSSSSDIVTAENIVSDGGGILTSQKGAANGICPLNSNSLIESQYLPSFVDDVIEAYARTGQTELSSSWLATGSASGNVIIPQSGIIYVLMNSSTTYSENSQFRWGGSTYIKLNDGGISAMTTNEIDTATDQTPNPS